MRAQRYNFIHISETQKLKQTYVYDIEQLSNRVILLGTESGLVQFDGKNFKDINPKDERILNTIFVQNDSVVYLGYFNGDIEIFNGFKTSILGKVSSGVKQFVRHQESIIILTKDGSITSLRGENLEAPDFGNFKNEDITDLTVVNEYLLLSYKGNKTTLIQDNVLLNTSDNLFSDYETKGKTRSFSHDDLLFQIDSEGHFSVSEIKNKKITPLSSIELKDELGEIEDLCFENDTTLWIATKSNGIRKLIFSDHSYESYRTLGFNTKNGLINNEIKSIFSDQQHNLWIGYYGLGLSLMKDENVLMIESLDNIPIDNVYAITANNEQLYFGTDQGLFSTNLLDQGLSQIDLPITDKTCHITSLQFDAGQRLWIGTKKDGAFRLETNGSITTISDRYKVKIGKVNDIEVANNGNVYIATDFGMVYFQSKTDQMMNISTNEGLVHNVLNAIHRSQNGTLWFASNGSAPFSYFEGEYTIHKDIKPLKQYNLTQVIDFHNHIAIGTEGDGVIIMKEDEIINLTTSNGLFSNTVYDLICDVSGNLWVICKNGISKFDEQFNLIKEIDKEALYNSNLNRNASYLDQQNRIWIGSDKGLIMINEINNDINYPPTIIFSALEWDGEIVRSVPETNAYGKHSLKVEFLGIDLKNPNDISYEYILEGYDSEWNKVQNGQNFASYQTLYDGEYTLKVKAIQPNGLESDVATLHFSVKAPFWKSIWFLIFTPLLILLVTIFAVRWRINIIKKQKIALERLVNNRTLELRKERDNLSEAKKEIENQNREITDSITYAERIQKALLNKRIAKDLFDFENFLIYLPRDIVSGDFYWFGKKENKSIIVIGDCTGHGVPGAFMSMISSTLLDKIIVEQQIDDAQQIVMSIDDEIVKALRTKDYATNDGIDLGVIVIDHEHSILDFCGSSRPLFIVSDGEIDMLKGNLLSVGEHFDTIDKAYKSHQIHYKKGDQFYLSSDGFGDQFGGDKNKKYMLGRVKKFIHSISDKPIYAQEALLVKEFKEWKGNTPQTDDIIFLGIKL